MPMQDRLFFSYSAAWLLAQGGSPVTQLQLHPNKKNPTFTMQAMTPPLFLRLSHFDQVGNTRDFKPSWVLVVSSQLKICSSNWIISPAKGDNEKYLKPPTRAVFSTLKFFELPKGMRLQNHTPNCHIGQWNTAERWILSTK